MGAGPPPRRWLGRLRRAVVVLLWATGIGLMLGALAVVLVVRHYERDLPSVAELRTGYDPPQLTTLLARDGTTPIAHLYTERRTLIRIETLPQHVRLAFLAAEDAHFYQHQGLDYLGMLRAIAVNLRAGRTKQGASTITQQVVKNILLDSERSYERKIREAILARRVEQHLTKDEIFELYLNHIYLGHGRYGVEEAARHYFSKHAREMTLAEAALLAGIVASPEKYSPRASPEKALKRRTYVLGQMLEKGFITPEYHQSESATPLPPLAPDPGVESDLAPDAVAWVRRLLEEVAGPRARRGGFVVHTTLDPALQVAAREALRAGLDGYLTRQKRAPPYLPSRRKGAPSRTRGPVVPGRAMMAEVASVDDAAGTLTLSLGDTHGVVDLRRELRFNPRRLAPSQFALPGALLRVVPHEAPESGTPHPASLEPGPQGALVVLDPATREIRALVGSYEQVAGGLDRATRSRRQPGSTFKPIIWSYALHARTHTPVTQLALPGADALVPDASRSLRSTLARSDNAAAQLLFRELGPRAVVSWARALGVESRLEPDMSAALGSYEVSPLELASVYATFASGGLAGTPTLVTRIVGPDGRDLPLPARPGVRRVMAPAEAWLTTSLLRSVVTAGTATRAAGLGRPLAGKTGTTNQARDAWFVGYSPELVTALWVGFDEPTPLGPGESGATTALPPWVEFMRAAHRGLPVTDFLRPEGITVVSVDPVSGLLAPEGFEGAVEEMFLSGTEPTTFMPEGGIDGGAEAGLDGGAEAGAPGEGMEAGAPEPGTPGSGGAPGAGAPGAGAPGSADPAKEDTPPAPGGGPPPPGTADPLKGEPPKAPGAAGAGP